MDGNVLPPLDLRPSFNRRLKELLNNTLSKRKKKKANLDGRHIVQETVSLGFVKICWHAGEG